MTHLGRLARLIYVARGRFFDSESNKESPNTENFDGGLVYSLHSFPQPHTGHLPDYLHLIHTIPPTSVQNHMKPLTYNPNFNIDARFSSYICYLQVKTNPTLIWKAKGYNAFYEKIIIALKQDKSELIQNMCVRSFCLEQQCDLVTRGHDPFE